MQALLDLVITLQFLVPQGNYDDMPTLTAKGSGEHCQKREGVQAWGPILMIFSLVIVIPLF
jgi:hypothetical protein